MEQQAKELLYSGRFEDGWTVLRQHIEDRRLKEQTTQSWEAEVRLMALLVMQCPFVVSAEDLLNHLRLMFNDNNGMMMANTVADDGQPWTVNMPSHLLLQLVNASIQNEDHECRHARCLLSNWLEHLPNEVRERVRLESLSNPQPSEFSHERQTYANLLCIYIQSVLIPLGASRWCQDCLDQHGFALTVDQLAELNKAITLLAAEERTITPDNSRSDSPFTSAAADAVNHGEENLSAVQSTLGRVKSAYRRSREALNELWQKPKPALSLVKSFLSGDRRRTALLTAGSLVFFMIALIYNARRQRWRQLPQRSAVFSRQSIDV